MLIDKILGLLDIGQKNGRETQQQEQTGKHQVSPSSKILGINSRSFSSNETRTQFFLPYNLHPLHMTGSSVNRRECLDGAGKGNGLPWTK